jgi:hypothetical protein
MSKEEQYYARIIKEALKEVKKKRTKKSKQLKSK